MRGSLRETRNCVTYIGKPKRCWCLRWLEHKSGVLTNNCPRSGHDVAKSDAVALAKGITNYMHRIFLEMLHSIINQDTVNEHAEFPLCSLLINSIN